jgi:hypothetical protein
MIDPAKIEWRLVFGDGWRAGKTLGASKKPPRPM